MLENLFEMKEPIYRQPLVKPQEYQQVQNNIFIANHYNQNQNNIIKTNQQNQNIIYPKNQKELSHNNIYLTNPIVQNNHSEEIQLNGNNIYSVNMLNQNGIYQTNNITQHIQYPSNPEEQNIINLMEKQNQYLSNKQGQNIANTINKESYNNTFPESFQSKYPLNQNNAYQLDHQNIYSKNQLNHYNFNPSNQNNIDQNNQQNIYAYNGQDQNNTFQINQQNQTVINPSYQNNQILLANLNNQINQNDYMIKTSHQNNNNIINGMIPQNNIVNNINPQTNNNITPNPKSQYLQMVDDQQITYKNNIYPNIILNHTNLQTQIKINNENQQLTLINLMENNKIVEKNNDIQDLNKRKKKKYNINNKKGAINKFKLNEKILLKNQKMTLDKDLDIKTHFDIEITKERYLFNYKKVLKIAIPLLSHYEMLSNCEYKCPLLSPDGQFLSCIARTTNKDTVFIWDLDDLYWYKYIFSIPKSKVDCATFTPDSKSLLIIYRNTNPILYSLENGEKILELEKNDEQNNKEGFHCAFTVKAGHFGYTTEKGYTLWSMKSGKIKQHIVDESPIKLLFNEYIITIKNDLICELKHLKTLKNYLSFKLKGIKNPNEILDARCTPDMSAFIYVIKQGIIKYKFKEKQFKGLQKFQTGVGVEKATISDDCRFVVKTNMRNLTIYDIEKGDTIGTILKEKFNEFRIDFNNEKLIVIDNICINIHDYTDGGIPEQFIWLNKNAYRFLDAKFSHDFKFLFALIDNNNVIAYDLNTGLIIKKWQNIDKNWTNFSISEYSGNEVASNSNLFLVKLWNYITGREDATFYGYDTHSFHFSSNGNHLACGAKNGPEVARIWNIEKGTFGSFPYIGNNSNFHTIVHLTSPEPTRLICCSIDQQPLIFDTNSKELLYKCECLYRFEEIYEIKSDQKYDVFIVKGRDVKKRDIGLMYRISDGLLLETYENYAILELAKDHGVIISKCDNVNGGKLTATDVKNLSDPILNDFQIQTDKIKLLNDNKCVVAVTNEDEYKTEYCLMNVEDGGYFGKINLNYLLLHFLKIQKLQN